jgi:hypothetical protein
MARTHFTPPVIFGYDTGWKQGTSQRNGPLSQLQKIGSPETRFYNFLSQDLLMFSAFRDRAELFFRCQIATTMFSGRDNSGQSGQAGKHWLRSVPDLCDEVGTTRDKRLAIFLSDILWIEDA